MLGPWKGMQSKLCYWAHLSLGSCQFRRMYILITLQKYHGSLLRVRFVIDIRRINSFQTHFLVCHTLGVAGVVLYTRYNCHRHGPDYSTAPPCVCNFFPPDSVTFWSCFADSKRPLSGTTRSTSWTARKAAQAGTRQLCTGAPQARLRQ